MEERTPNKEVGTTAKKGKTDNGKAETTQKNMILASVPAMLRFSRNVASVSLRGIFAPPQSRGAKAALNGAARSPSCCVQRRPGVCRRPTSQKEVAPEL